MCRLEDQSTQLGLDSAEVEMIQNMASKILKHVHSNLERKAGDQEKLMAKQAYLSDLLQCCDHHATAS